MTDQTRQTDAAFVRISGLDNAIEAQLVTSILAERGIPHQVRSHHDTAYDGLYQMQKGWGEILAPESCRSKIREIIYEVRADVPDIDDS